MTRKDDPEIENVKREIEKQITKNFSKRNVELSLQILNNIRKVKT